MRKKYPYLEESYTPLSKVPQKIIENYSYMESSYNYNLNTEQKKQAFLAKIDTFINQKQYINMTLLDWKENPIKEIQGIISSGSISKDGNSNVRRSANLTCSVSRGEYNVDRFAVFEDGYLLGHGEMQLAGVTLESGTIGSLSISEIPKTLGIRIIQNNGDTFRLDENGNVTPPSLSFN